MLLLRLASEMRQQQFHQTGSQSRDVPACVYVRVDDHTVLLAMPVEQLITVKPVLVNRSEEMREKQL